MNESLLKILRCPIDGAELVYLPETNELINHQSNLAYPIHKGIPLLVANYARAINTDAEC